MEHSNTPLENTCGRLMSYAKDSLLSDQEALNTTELTDLFNLPLSAQAYDELMLLDDILQNHRSDLAKDCWNWKSGNMGKYTAKKFYTMVHAPIQSNPLLNWIWKSCCILKTKVFAWLVIMDRINTKDMILRRH